MGASKREERVPEVPEHEANIIGTTRHRLSDTHLTKYGHGTVAALDSDVALEA
jgi:hypothetical protein